jgi:hypothetical protein
MTRAERIRLFEANYGREFGWFVETNGRRVAALSDVRWEDMFWHSYAVHPLGEDPAESDEIFRAGFWAQVSYRNRVTGDVVVDVLPGGATPTRDNPRIAMRALYVRLSPTIIERALLWLRKVRR